MAMEQEGHLLLEHMLAAAHRIQVLVHQTWWEQLILDRRSQCHLFLLVAGKMRLLADTFAAACTGLVVVAAAGANVAVAAGADALAAVAC